MPESHFARMGTLCCTCGCPKDFYALLEAGSIPRIFKAMATNAGLQEDVIAKLSGHSTRVGAAQDMVAAGLEVTEVMQAGGWKTPTMVARYSEHLQARRGAAAKLAEKQGRAGETVDSPSPTPSETESRSDSNGLGA